MMLIIIGQRKNVLSKFHIPASLLKCGTTSTEMTSTDAAANTQHTSVHCPCLIKNVHMAP